MPLIPSFVALGTKINVVLATLMFGPFLIFSLLLLRFPAKKSPAELPFLGVPKG